MGERAIHSAMGVILELIDIPTKQNENYKLKDLE